MKHLLWCSSELFLRSRWISYHSEGSVFRPRTRLTAHFLHHCAQRPRYQARTSAARHLESTHWHDSEMIPGCYFFSGQHDCIVHDCSRVACGLANKSSASSCDPAKTVPSRSTCEQRERTTLRRRRCVTEIPVSSFTVHLFHSSVARLYF